VVDDKSISVAPYRQQAFNCRRGQALMLLLSLLTMAKDFSSGNFVNAEKDL